MKSYFYKSLMTSWGKVLKHTKISLQPQKKLGPFFLVLNIKIAHERVKILMYLLISKLFIDLKTLSLTSSDLRYNLRYS